MDWKRTLAWVAVVAVLGIPAAGQSTQTTDRSGTPRINHRQRHQPYRIAYGARDGQLTAGETRHLEHEQARIQRTKTKDKADGAVTPQERAQLTRMQNRASRNIYRDKHNGRTAGDK